MPRVPKPATLEQAADDSAILAGMRARDYEGLASRFGAAPDAGVFGGHSSVIIREILERIGEQTPTILKGVRPALMPELREVAALCYLAGKGKPYRRWLARDVDTGISLDGDACVRMLLFAAYGARNLSPRSLHPDIPPERYRIRVCATADSCDSCKAVAGQTYAWGTAPDLPHSGCTHRYGCRCIYATELQPPEADEAPAGIAAPSLLARVVGFFRQP